MSQKRFFNFIAYVAIFCIALALVLEVILGAGTAAGRVCDWIAFICMIIVVGAGGFLYARSKRAFIWMILYAAALVVIIVFKLIPLF